MLKKSTLIALALCLIVGGIGIGVAGIALGGKTQFSFDHRGWQFEDYDWESQNFGENFSSNQHGWSSELENIESFNKIDITSGTVAVTIKEGDAYGISVDVGSKVEVQYDIKGDTLYVEQEGSRMNWNFMGNKSWDEYGGEIVITVPEGTKLEKTSVLLGVGEGYFENIATEKFNLRMGVASTNIQGLTANQVTLEGGVGELNLEESNLGDAKINMGVGSVRVKTALSGDLDIQGGLGDLEIVLNGEEKDYNYEITRGGGKIAINDEKYNGVGDINIRNKSDQTIDIEAGLGSVSIVTH